MMDLVFCGTPLFAVPTLEKLVCTGFRVKLVATQPDRPSGRGMQLTASPVKHTALALRPSHRLSRRRSRTTTEFRAQLESIAPEAIIVVGYGRIIPQWMIDLPRLGNINLHASLLPKYRGAAPIQWAIATGESVTGVTTMRIDAGLDTGDILLQSEERILPEDTALTLAPRLAQTGAELMIATLAGLKSGSITPRPQDNAKATLAPILKREDGLIDFSRSASGCLEPLARISTMAGSVYQLSRQDAAHSFGRTCFRRRVSSGGHFAIENDRLLLGFAHGTALEVRELQVEGKKRMSAHDFINGYRPRTDELWGVERASALAFST